MNGVPTPPNSVQHGNNNCPSCHDVRNMPSGGETNTCASGYCLLIEKLKLELAGRINAEAMVARLERENEELRGQLNRRVRRNTDRTWHEMVRNRLQPPNPADVPLRLPPRWDDIYKQCCLEENMSTTIDWIHPNIRLVAPGITGPPMIEEEAATPVPAIPFPFERLPWNVQAEIFKLWLFKEGQLVHALTRLDKFTELQTFPDVGAVGRDSGLPRGFYWGKTYYNVTDDRRDPNKVLHLLLVCRRFYFIGVHCFYALNTFAFSSLGEFERFGNGIGFARLGRIQHVELALQGNQYRTIPVPTGKKKIPFSRRTFGLYLLQDCYRIRTLVVHLNETGPKYLRRPYEPVHLKKFMTGKTAGQPNGRMTRSLRCLQGLDCIHQLRGLSWVRFYDLFKAVGTKEADYTGERVEVRDWSFVEDVMNVTTQPKVPTRLNTSRLENLLSLFGGGVQWTPSDEDWAIVKTYYIDDNEHLSYDNLRRHGNHQDLDVPSHFSATDSINAADSDDDDNSSSSSSSSSSSDDGGGRGGVADRLRAAAPRRRRAAITKKPPPPLKKKITLRISNDVSSTSSSSDSSDTDSNSDDSDSGIIPPPRRPPGGLSKGGPSKGRHRTRKSPDLDLLLEQIRNGEHSDNSNPSSDGLDSDSDDSDSDVDSNAANTATHSISLLTDDEEDGEDEVIVVDSDSDDESGLFVTQDPANGPTHLSETPNQTTTSPEETSPPTQATPNNSSTTPPNRDDSVIPIDWHRATSSLARLRFLSTSRRGTGSTATPPVAPPRRSTSSGLFVRQSPRPQRSPSVESEDSAPIIAPGSANKRIDLTVSTPTVLPMIVEDDEDEGGEDIIEDGEDEGGEAIRDDDGGEGEEPGRSPPRAGSKRATPGEDSEEEDGEGASPKRARTSSPGGDGEGGGGEGGGEED